MGEQTNLMSNPRTVLRRKALRTLIDDGRWAGNVTAFAKEVGKPQSQVQDMLDGRKAFGEKVARQLESKAGLPAGALDGNQASANLVRDVSAQVVYGSPISVEASLLGREWDKLKEPLKAHIRELILMLVGAQVRESRAKSKGKPRGYGSGLHT